MLRAAARPDHGFDAIVIGEFGRAFAGRHARLGFAQLHACGVLEWLAEFDGPIDLTDPCRQSLLGLLGQLRQHQCGLTGPTKVLGTAAVAIWLTHVGGTGRARYQITVPVKRADAARHRRQGTPDGRVERRLTLFGDLIPGRG